MNGEELASAEKELGMYIGKPKCMDCGWKLGTDITNYCSCNPSRDDQKHLDAFNRARELQAIVKHGKQERSI